MSKGKVSCGCLEQRMEMLTIVMGTMGANRRQRGCKESLTLPAMVQSLFSWHDPRLSYRSDGNGSMDMREMRWVKKKIERTRER